MSKICQIEGCPNLQMYAIYKTFPDGTKKWLQVCQRHEQEIGDENMRRAGGPSSQRLKAPSSAG